MRLLEEAGIRAYVPLAAYEQSSRYYRQRAFTNDPEQDSYTCPQGAVLRLRGNNDVTGVRIYQAPTETCAVCPYRARCTESKEGRRPTRRRCANGRSGSSRCSERRKRGMGCGGCGLNKVHSEALLIAAGQNLKRLLSRHAWGQRPWPHGAAGLRLAPAALPMARLPA